MEAEAEGLRFLLLLLELLEVFAAAAAAAERVMMAGCEGVMIAGSARG